MSVVFFTDRDLGLQFPAILRDAGLRVERHADHFAPDCPDDEWLREVAGRSWVAITHDQRIRYKRNELAAIIDHKVTLLVVVGKAPYADLARSFVVRSRLHRGSSAAGHRQGVSSDANGTREKTPRPPDGRTAGQHVRVLCDPIEGVGHRRPPTHSSEVSSTFLQR